MTQFVCKYRHIIDCVHNSVITALLPWCENCILTWAKQWNSCFTVWPVKTFQCDRPNWKKWLILSYIKKLNFLHFSQFKFTSTKSFNAICYISLILLHFNRQNHIFNISTLVIKTLHRHCHIFSVHGEPPVKTFPPPTTRTKSSQRWVRHSGTQTRMKNKTKQWVFILFQGIHVYPEEVKPEDTTS